MKTFCCVGKIKPGHALTATDRTSVYLWVGDDLPWRAIATGDTVDDSVKVPIAVASRSVSITALDDGTAFMRTDPWPIPPPPPPRSNQPDKIRATLDAPWLAAIVAARADAWTFIATPIAGVAIEVDDGKCLVWELDGTTWVRVADGDRQLSAPLLIIRKSQPPLAGTKDDASVGFTDEDPWPIPPPPPPRVTGQALTNHELAQELIAGGHRHWRDWV